METDRKQIEKLIHLIVPPLMIWTTLCASFCYDLGKNGLNNIDWMGIIQTNIPVIIISTSLFFYGRRKLSISCQTTN